MSLHIKLAWEPRALPGNKVFSVKDNPTILRTFSWFCRGPLLKFVNNRPEGSWAVIGYLNKNSDLFF